MAYIPMSCPSCHASYPQWKNVATDNYQAGISGKKAILGGVLFGPAGAVLGGLSGKKKQAKTYICTKCGFSHTYTD